MNVAVQRRAEVARPVKVLVPLIKQELIAGDEAGLEHYRRAGALLVEVKESKQVPHGSWSRWLKSNFDLSQTTAIRYMLLARRVESGQIKLSGAGQTVEDALGHRPRRERHAKWGKLHDATDRVDVSRFDEERQSREKENKLHRELAVQLVDLGYKALATRLHPDRGGSRDAMARLNHVRDELKSIAESKRFV